jgi:hypothetical protein
LVLSLPVGKASLLQHALEQLGIFPSIARKLEKAKKNENQGPMF